MSDKLYNPFIMIDFISPVYEKVFSKEKLKEVYKRTNEYTDDVFVFDIKEIRIKCFYETRTVIKIGRKEQLTPTVTVVFTDESELVTKLSIKDFMTIFLPEYLLKLNQIFPSEAAQQNV
jgi:hypothetical protein